MEIVPKFLPFDLSYAIVYPEISSKKIMSCVINKGSPIPFQHQIIYYTLTDNQDRLEFELYEGKSLCIEDNNCLGKFLLKGLPKKRAGECKIVVKYIIDVDGNLTVTSKEEECGYGEIELLVKSYEGCVSKNEFLLIEKFGQSNPKGQKIYKLRKLINEMNKSYDKIINSKQEKEDGEDDEDEDEQKKNKTKFSIICNYSHYIEDIISIFDEKDFQNEEILEKIFYYLEKLFISYKMALEIKNQVTKEFQAKLEQKIMDYFNQFYEIKIFWLKDLLEILKDTPINFFFKFAFLLMTFFKVKGQKYKSESNIFYSKHHYKGVFDICEKYKLDIKKDGLDRSQQEIYKLLKKQCLDEINNLNSKYFLEYQIQKDENKNNEEKNIIKENMKDILNNISKNAREMEKCDFTKYIIENHPPIEYIKEDDYIKKYKENPYKALEDLSIVYHNSNYYGEDIIFAQIEKELNIMKTLKDEYINKKLDVDLENNLKDLNNIIKKMQKVINELNKKIKEYSLDNSLKEKEIIKLKEHICIVENEKKEILKLNNQLNKDLIEQKKQYNELNKKIINLPNDLKEAWDLFKKKDKKIEDLELQIKSFPIQLSENEKLISIILKTEDENIIQSIICKNKNKFKEIEDIFYLKYPEYTYFENIFFNDKGNKIKRNKNLDENGINDNDIIIIKTDS